MLCIKKIKKPILIWGTTIKAVRFFLNNKSSDIIGFMDSSATQNTKMLSLPVYNPYIFLNDSLKNYFIVFCGSDLNYKNAIKKHLNEKGLTEFEDFAYYKYFTHQIIYLHGNCHIFPIEEILCSSTEFNNKYYIIYEKAIHEFSKDEEIPMCILNNIDFYVHMDIRPNNEYGYKLSDEYILPKLSCSCKNITIPNLFNLSSITAVRRLLPRTSFGERKFFTI